jgi:hypothetical protein
LSTRSRVAWMILPGLLALAGGGVPLRAQARAEQPPPTTQAHDQDMQNMDMPGMNMGASPDGSGKPHGMSTEQQAQAEAMRAMAPGQVMDMAHMRMTALRPANEKDRERADRILAAVRQFVEPYKDYRVALADGYRIFLPQMPQAEYHFNNYWNGFVESFTFDPTRPTSLLYKKTRDGGWELTGVMYTAPRSDTLEQLDERVPLSVARWHQHINLCMPRRDTRPNWKVFGLNGSITTEKACDEAGGRFFPQIFGWMVHVYPFAPPDKIFAH